jgi:hypothetical protein
LNSLRTIIIVSRKANDILPFKKGVNILDLVVFVISPIFLCVLHHLQLALPHFCQFQERQQDSSALVFLFLKTHCSSLHIVCLILSMWPPHHWLVPLSSWQWQKDLFHSSSNIILQYDLIWNNMNIWVYDFLSYALLCTYHTWVSQRVSNMKKHCVPSYCTVDINLSFLEL